MVVTSVARTLWVGLLAATLALAGGLAPASSLAADAPPAGGTDATTVDATLPASTTASDRVIVRWTDGGASLAIAEPLRAAALSHALGGRVSFVRSGAHGMSIYRLASRLGPNAATKLAAIRRVTGVAVAQPDRLMTRADLPDDPYAENLWSLAAPADGGSPYGIDATTAWPQSTGVGAVVAVVDTGITDHLDLAGQVLPGYDMISDPEVAGDGDGRDPNAADEGDWEDWDSSSWHGTHVAGTIAALAGNGLGVFGAAPGAKVVPVRVLGHGGGYESDIMDGIAWAGGASVLDVPANPNPARVINVSLGGGGDCDPFLQEAIDDARAMGALVVVAAGNADSEAARFAPANCKGVLAVAATDAAGRRADFSNFGSTVGIAAPGVDILSTMNAGRTVPVENPAGSVYSTYSGTSMAAPHVTAAAALLVAAYPDLLAEQVATLLRESARPFPAASPAEAEPCATVLCGSGIVNVPAAFDRLVAGPPLVGTPVLPAWSMGGHEVTVRATAASGVGIAGATAVIDGGAPIAMAATDGAFGGRGERLELTFTAPVAEGPHEVCITASSTTALDSTPACAPFGVDSTLPTSTAVRLSATSVAAGRPVEMSASFTDDASGIGSVALTWDGARLPAGTADGTTGDLQETALGIAGGAAESVVAGTGQSCVLTPDGGVACWGFNDAGQLGDATTVSRAVARVVKVGGPAIAVSGSQAHGCAVRTDHHLVCWGTDTGGQFSTTAINAAPPMEIAGVTDAVAVAAGLFSTCVLHEDGTVTCLGAFLTTEDYDLVPVDTSSLTDVVAIGGSYFSACALRADGTVWCWGAGPMGELGNGRTLDSDVPVRVSGIRDAVAIGVGDEFACAVRSDRSVWCWGANVMGQLGRVPTPAELRSGLQSLSAVPVPVPGVTGATAVSAGFNHACATGTHGTWCWGGNAAGQVGTGEATPAEPPTRLADTAAVVTAGVTATCVDLAGGAVRCWGAGAAGALGNGNLYVDEVDDTELTPQDVVGFAGTPATGDHEVCVLATDLAGNATAPVCRTVTVVATTAAAPSMVVAHAGNGRVEVTWQPPVTDGASPVTGYEVTAPEGIDGCTVAAAVRSCTVGGLENGFVHAFGVVALTDRGSGPAATAAAISATGSVARIRLTTGRFDVARRRTPALVALATDVPAFTPGLAYRFAVRTASGAVPGAGTSGAWGVVPAKVGTPSTYEGWATVGGAASPVFTSAARTIVATQDTSGAVRYTGTWIRRPSASAFGGSRRSASTKGRAASFRVAGSSVAWVGALGPDRGRASVYVDGHRRATIDLYARTASGPTVVWAADLARGTHTVKIVVLGTHNARSHGSRVDLDAFLHLR